MPFEDRNDLATFLDTSEFGEVFLLPGGERIDALWNAAEDVDFDTRGLLLEVTCRDVDVRKLTIRSTITRQYNGKSYRIVEKKPDGIDGFTTLRLEGEP